MEEFRVQIGRGKEASTFPKDDDDVEKDESVKI